MARSTAADDSARAVLGPRRLLSWLGYRLLQPVAPSIYRRWARSEGTLHFLPSTSASSAEVATTPSAAAHAASVRVIRRRMSILRPTARPAAATSMAATLSITIPSCPRPATYMPRRQTSGPTSLSASHGVGCFAAYSALDEPSLVSQYPRSRFSLSLTSFRSSTVRPDSPPAIPFARPMLTVPPAHFRSARLNSLDLLRASLRFLSGSFYNPIYPRRPPTYPPDILTTPLL
jgi:hypothetical protein